ncbi:MAG TPA: PQQ-binding-like beta-propeller repeat protein [Blastocatellia bacterium]|nr:PQQ-binding-like beta-propeller repeat protein [Blastocatellia bacterium]
MQFRGHYQLTGVSTSQVPANLRVLWTYQAGESIESSAAIYGGVAFVGAAKGDKGELVAVDMQSGQLRWKYETPGPIGESSPCAGSEAVFIGDLSGMLHAVSREDGRGLWTFKTNGEIKSSPVLVDGKVLIGSYDEHLYCLSASNGAVLWKVRTNGYVHGTPAVHNGMAFVTGCDEIFRAIRISDGREMYRVASGAYTGASPAIVGQFAYYGTFNNDVLGVNLTTRRIAWRYRHPQRQFPFYASAAVEAGRVVVGGRDKMVHCIDANTGKSVWTFATRARVESSPALAGNRVYVGSNDGRFYVLDFQTGAKLWEFNAGAPLSASPAIASGRIVIGSQDGRLYCFG